MINCEEQYEILLEEIISLRLLLSLIYNLDKNADVEAIQELISICIIGIDKAVNESNELALSIKAESN